MKPQEINFDDWEECSINEYCSLTDKGLDRRVIYENGKEIKFFKKKETFPKLIRTEHGYSKIDEWGSIEVLDSSERRSYISYLELEEYQEIIKQAIKIRDKQQ